MSRFERFMSFTRPLRILQFFVAILIFCYAALTPSPQLLGQHSDSSMHFVGNVLLYISAWLAFWRHTSIFKLLLFLIPFSAAVEFAQYFSPGRTVDYRDLMVNLIGLSAAALLMWIFKYILGGFASGNRS